MTCRFARSRARKTKAIYEGFGSCKFRAIELQARKRLRWLDAATSLAEIGVILNELGRALRVPMNRISAIINGKRAITVDTAMRLARYFGTSPQYWLNPPERPRPRGGQRRFSTQENVFRYRQAL